MCKLSEQSPLSIPYQGEDLPIDFDNLSDDEKIDIVARRILERHKEAFLELAK